VAVERCQLSAQFSQIKNLIDAAQQMSSWDIVIKAEAVEQLVLCLRSLSHHLDAPSDVALNIGDGRRIARGVFQQNRPKAVRPIGDFAAAKQTFKLAN
jgi:hypothetical protein